MISAQSKEQEIRGHLRESERQHKDALMELEMTSNQMKEYKLKLERMKKSKQLDELKSKTAKVPDPSTKKEMAEDDEEAKESSKTEPIPKRAFRNSSSPKKSQTEKRRTSIKGIMDAKVSFKTDDAASLVLQRVFRKSMARKRFRKMIEKAKLESVLVNGTGCPEVNGMYVKTGSGRDTSYIKHDKSGTFQVRRLTATRWVIGGVPSALQDQDTFKIYYVADHHADRKATPPVIGWNLGNVGKVPLPTLELILDRAEYQRYELVAPGARFISDEPSWPILEEVGQYDGVAQFQALSHDKKHIYTLRRIESKQLDQRIWIIARVSIMADSRDQATHQVLWVNIELGALSFPPKSNWYLGQDGSGEPSIVKKEPIKGTERADALKAMADALRTRPTEIQSMFGYPFD